MNVAPFSRAQRARPTEGAGRQVPKGAAGWHNLDQLFPDALLPSQTGSTPSLCGEGERRLFVAILLDACLRAPRVKNKEALELEAWARGADALVPLRTICDALGLDFTKVSTRLVEMVATNGQVRRGPGSYEVGGPVGRERRRVAA